MKQRARSGSAGGGVSTGSLVEEHRVQGRRVTRVRGTGLHVGDEEAMGYIAGRDLCGQRLCQLTCTPMAPSAVSIIRTSGACSVVKVSGPCGSFIVTCPFDTDTPATCPGAMEKGWLR